jgi:hypothetical protein
MEVAVSMMWCQRAGSCQPIGTRDANQSCERNYLKDAHYRAFCSVFGETDGEA